MPQQTHAEVCVPPACHNTHVKVSMSPVCHMHAEFSVAPVCHLCASARACRGERANTHVPSTYPRCAPPTCPSSPVPVLAGGALAKLAEALVQASTAGTPQHQCQRQPQQRAQQQGRGQGASPCGRAARQPPLCPSPPPTPAQSPILRACLIPHLAQGRQGRCPGCRPLRGCHRLGGPSPAHSGSARGCCTPEWVTLAELSP